MSKIRVGILGYGNLGRGVELALGNMSDMELVGIFTRRKGVITKSGEALNVDKLADYIGKEVTLGIRPDDFHFEEFYKTAEGSNRVTFVSENCELTGSEINIYSHIGEARVIARVASDIVVDDGSSVSLLIDTEKIHIFNKETGELICD